MSATEPQRSAKPAQPSEAPKKRNWWIWISAGLAVVAVALLVWGLSTRSDLDSSQQEVAQLKDAAAKSQESTSAAASTYKAAYEDLQKQLGAANADLAATQEDLKAAEQAAAESEQQAATAQKNAEAAKQNAASAGTQAEKADAQIAQANAEAEQAQADAKAAEAKTAVVADCAKASATALQPLFESSDPQAQSAAVKKQLQEIGAECQSALSAAAG